MFHSKLRRYSPHPEPAIEVVKHWPGNLLPHIHFKNIMLKMRRMNYQIPGSWEKNHNQLVREHALPVSQEVQINVPRGEISEELTKVPHEREKGLTWHERPNLLWSSVSSFGPWVISPIGETSSFKSKNGELWSSLIQRVPFTSGLCGPWFLNLLWVLFTFYFLVCFSAAEANMFLPNDFTLLTWNLFSVGSQHNPFSIFLSY